MSAYNDMASIFGSEDDIKRAELRLKQDAYISDNKYYDSHLEEIDELELNLKNKKGKLMTIKILPKALVYNVKNALAALLNENKFAHIHELLRKPIRFTCDGGTAHTDGRKIYFDLFWAHQLMQEGEKSKNRWLFNNTKGNFEGEIKNKEAIELLQKGEEEFITYCNDLALKYIKFTILHECYHVFYMHFKRMYTRYSQIDKRTMVKCNIAGDIEINRNLEHNYREYKGCAKDIDLIWYKNQDYFSKENKPFELEYFEDIVDNVKDSTIDELLSREEDHEDYLPDTNRTVEKKSILDTLTDLLKIYDLGYNFAIDSIIDDIIDPLTFPI